MILDEIKKLTANDGIFFVAIDGMCCAGKSTLAKNISKHCDINVFKTDDFFTPIAVRDEQEIACCFDSKRFLDEIILKVLENKQFTYNRFDCKTQSLIQSDIIKPKKINVVEGTYSMHKDLQQYYSLSIFLSISPIKQRLRVRGREKDNAGIFFEKWIPFEEVYFNSWKIKDCCKIKQDNLNE